MPDELVRRIEELRKEKAQAKPKSVWQTSLDRQIGELQQAAEQAKAKSVWTEG